VHQVVNQSRLYYDARSTSHQDYVQMFHEFYETCVWVAKVVIKCNGKYRRLEGTQQAILQRVIY